MKYKAIKIVHTELSIADNLNKFTGKKKRHFFSLPPSGFFLSFTCTETSCGSSCWQSSRDIEEMFYQGLKHGCAPGTGTALVFEQEPQVCAGKGNLSAWSVSNVQAAAPVPAQEHTGEFSQRNTLPCPQLDATQMQSHVIKRPFSPGELVVGKDAHTHTH